MSNVKMIDYPLVKVTWYDAVSSDEWYDPDEVEHEMPHKIETVGFLVFDDGNVIIAQNIDRANNQMSMVMTIPASWIEVIEYLYL